MKLHSERQYIERCKSFSTYSKSILTIENQNRLAEDTDSATSTISLQGSVISNSSMYTLISNKPTRNSLTVDDISKENCSCNLF